MRTPPLALGVMFLLASSAHADPCASSHSAQDLSEPFRKLAQKVEPAIKAELGVGFTHFTPAPNGIWYQKEFPYDLHMNSKSYSVGGVMKLDEHNKVRAGVQYLGKASSNSMATASDENYDRCRHELSNCWPLSHWYGKGDVSELYLTLDHRTNFRGIPIILESGLVAYRATWKMTIPDWRQSESGSPRYLQVIHNPRLQPSLEVGIGVDLGHEVSLMYSIQSTMARGDGWPAIYKGLSQNLSVRKEF